MAWIYSQYYGTMHHVTDEGVTYLGQGYAGRGQYLNSPDHQDVHGYDGCADAGPLPRGVYTLDFKHINSNHGPVSIPLVPDPSNRMCGRGSFYVHAQMKDEATNPHQASEGCIALSPQSLREQIRDSGDAVLLVVA